MLYLSSNVLNIQVNVARIAERNVGRCEMCVSQLSSEPNDKDG